ncbi:molybdopterin biosynthesis protein [Petroclostridium xylanilyticum]|uniref:molybdopterin biosynthesis protein n=1 Tax=Petroclostridium xylanilyticum TaxID=1792311 RepID=UPI000B986E54|nr:molybdopterin biosynthesis protein [Petroclostridium xylanilyticum]
MDYSYLHNLELEDALKIYIDALKSAEAGLGTEEIPVKDSLGRITAEAVYARISSPHYNACAMDGIALCAKSTFGATETTPVVLEEHTDFIRVDTGDPLPDEFDAVVMIEDVIDSGDGKILLINAAVPWQHVRQIGEDICAGEIILTSNTQIRPAAIGAMLAGGVMRVKVKKKPVVGIIATGDELVSSSETPQKGQVIEFNSSIFSSMLLEWGAVPRVYKRVRDNLRDIKDAILNVAQECDMVIVNAGSSAGREDFSSRAISEVGNMLVHGIAIRPGKPAILGLIGNRPVIGIPGYPVSGIIVMDMVVKPVIEHLKGVAFCQEDKVKAILSRKILSSFKYREFVRVSLGYVNDRLIATPLNRGAGVVTSFVKADGILEIPTNSEGYERNTQVNVRLLKSENEIRNTVNIIGSHDPLIDIAADLMRIKYPGQYVSSSHVGSLGGIMAIKRSETHLAGIHLLDEETGEYNTSYIKKYLANEKIAVVKGVRRIQGLMVAPGNPKNIKSITDICGSGLRYVNRQKGSGTRILLDYMLKKGGITAGKIYGYEREEYTHMSVAALVAAGSADTGLGIYSAAKIYGLDFIPICEEQYDFIVPERHLELVTVRQFIDILRSSEFKNLLEKMGGYVVNDAGKIIG